MCSFLHLRMWWQNDAYFVCRWILFNGWAQHVLIKRRKRKKEFWAKCGDASLVYFLSLPKGSRKKRSGEDAVALRNWIARLPALNVVIGGLLRLLGNGAGNRSCSSQHAGESVWLSFRKLPHRQAWLSREGWGEKGFYSENIF